MFSLPLPPPHQGDNSYVHPTAEITKWLLSDFFQDRCLIEWVVSIFLLRWKEWWISGGINLG